MNPGYAAGYGPMTEREAALAEARSAVYHAEQRADEAQAALAEAKLRLARLEDPWSGLRSGQARVFGGMAYVVDAVGHRAVFPLVNP